MTPAVGVFLTKSTLSSHLPRTLSYGPQEKTQPQLSEKTCDKEVRHLAAIGSRKRETEQRNPKPVLVVIQCILCSYITDSQTKLAEDVPDG